MQGSPWVGSLPPMSRLFTRAGMVARRVVPYAGLFALATGAARLTSSLAGASTGLLVGGCIVAPAVVLIVQVALVGGHRVAQLMGGKPADERLTALVHEVAAKAEMPPPAHVYEIPSGDANAFAAGLSRRGMTVSVTSGLRSALSTQELKAVVAHEMGHIRSGDVSANMHLAATVAGLGGVYEAGRLLSKRKRQSKGDKSRVVGLALMAGGLSAKLVAELFRCSNSRRRELVADQMGVQLYGADAMASALRKIHAWRGRPWQGPAMKDVPGASAFAHAYISSPSVEEKAVAAGKRKWWQRVLHAFDTHPTLEERIAAIRSH